MPPLDASQCQTSPFRIRRAIHADYRHLESPFRLASACLEASSSSTVFEHALNFSHKPKRLTYVSHDLFGRSNIGNNLIDCGFVRLQPAGLGLQGHHGLR